MRLLLILLLTACTPLSQAECNRLAMELEEAVAEHGPRATEVAEKERELRDGGCFD